MLISHRYRFIYTKTMKTAGTSVESFFERFCMPEGEWTQSHTRDEYESPTGVIGYRGENPKGRKWYNHMPASSIKELIGQNAWDSYFKFCVVRNPFDKCISGFCYMSNCHKVEQQSTSNTTQYRNMNPQQIRFLDYTQYRNMNPQQIRFLDYVQRKAPIDRDKYLINGEFCLDDVIRYENLKADMERICQRIGLPFDDKYLPTFKAGIRGEDATIESLYTEKSREAVEKLFAFELMFFGYRFTDCAA